MKIKGFYRKPILPKTPLEIMDGKINAIDQKVDTILEEKSNEIISKTTQIIEQLKEKTISTIQEIKQGEPGETGQDAKPIDEEKLKNEILSQIEIPQIDEKSLIDKVISRIPENKASLKIIQETFETDPMSVIDKILLLGDKFKLKLENIDGLEQTISAFRNQVGTRGYLHGGGDTVSAGTNITITTNSAGQKVISATISPIVGVTSVNGITGAVTLAAGSGITLNQAANIITLSVASSIVTSVSGTANRITSTGGTDPVIDISTVFEALLGKVANPLSQFAATTSAQLAGIITDETGTGALVFAGSPVFTGTPTAPTAAVTINNTQLATTQFVQSFTNALAGGAVIYAAQQPYNVKADGTNQSANLQSAINAAQTLIAGGVAGVTINLPSGDIKIVTGLMISSQRIVIKGAEGWVSTQLVYTPTGNGTAITFDSSGTEISYNGLMNVQISSTDTTYVKTAIKIVDASQFLIKNIRIQGFLDTTLASIGLDIRGREFYNAEELSIAADTPLVFNINPNISIGIDESIFHNLALYPTPTKHAWMIADGVNVTRLTFDKVWSAFGGFYWHDTTSVIGHDMFVINNFHCEQINPRQFVIDISNTLTVLRAVNLSNITTGSALEEDGIKLRGIQNVLISNYAYLGTGVALDIDSSNDRVTLQNISAPAGGTASLSGLFPSYKTENGIGSSIPTDAVFNNSVGGLTSSKLIIYPNQNSTVSLIVKGDNNQSSHIQEWQDSSGAVLANVGNAVNTEGGRGWINVSNPYTDITGVGYKFSSNAGTNTGLFQLDGGGSMVFRNSSASGGMYFDAQGSSEIIFRTTNSFSERMRINNAGKVGIGIPSPAYMLDVNGDINIPTGSVYRINGVPIGGGGGVGTVTSVSVVSANGFAGTVANATTTPAITLTTSINSPILAGNGTALIAATTTGAGSTAVLNDTPTLLTPVFTGLPTGTGVASAATASTLAARNLNANLLANNFIEGFRSTATATGTTTLVVGDAYQQYFTGSTTQTVKLPVVTTLVNGQSFLIVNNSTGVITVQTSGANTIQAMVGSSWIVVTVIDTTAGTGTASWSWSYVPSMLSTNTASTLVLRDGSGNFSAGTITAALTGNSSTATALQNARTIGGVSFDGTANITVATATGGFTVSGGALALGANNLTMTGSLAATGARVTKGWFTDIESTNIPTVGGTAILTSLTAPQFTTIELGAASDTTLSRVSAGLIAVEGITLVDVSTGQTLTNKTFTTPVINGAITGTGQASAATVSTIMMRDANANSAINNLAEGFTTTATVAGTTTLTITATYTQVWTGSSTQTVKLPTTSILQGQQYFFINLSTQAVTVQSSGANTIVILAANTSCFFTAVVATPTTAANWSYAYAADIVTSGKSLSVSNTLTLAGTDATTMTFPSTSATIARTDAAQTFTGAQTIASIIGNKIYPASDSVTAIQILKADGTTNIFNVDSTNSRVGIGTAAPANKFEVSCGNVDGIRVTSTNSPYIRMYSTAGGGNRNFGFAVNYDASPLLQIQRSTTAGGDPTTNVLAIDGNGNVGIGTTTMASLLVVNGLINMKNYTVATLPAGTRGDIAYVTDALTPAFNVIIVGGGAVVTPVFFNGTNWVAM